MVLDVQLNFEQIELELGSYVINYSKKRINKFLFKIKSKLKNIKKNKLQTHL